MVDIADEDFQDEFITFGVAVENADVFDKLRQFCQIYRMDAGEMVCEWLAFSTNKKNVRINCETLDAMEREQLSKKQSKAVKTPTNTGVLSSTYNINTLEQVMPDDVLDAYATPNNKLSNKRQITPDNPAQKRLVGSGRNPVQQFSPASFSPAQSATPSRTYSNRSNNGQVVCSWGTTDNMQWLGGQSNNIQIQHYNSTAALTTHFKYMFQKLSDKAHVLNDMVEEMGDFLKAKHNIEEYAHVAVPTQETVSVVGRVCCDTVGKLNSKSVVLEGSRETSAGKLIPLDLSQLPQFSLFPGQVIAMEGMNASGNKFVAKKIFDGCELPLPDTTVTGSLSVVVASGPYTTSDSIMYEPLGDLVKYLHKHQPDVCILMGPFVDSKQPGIEESISEMTFEEFFANKIVKVLADATSRLQTQLVFVPSARDLHHDYVYPQPPFSIPDFKNKNVHFVSDPCTLNINGVVFGLTSTDVLFHLGTEETSGGISGDRLSRLMQHILLQHNYYPLCPGHDEMNIDYDQFELYTRLPCTPHIFITPSDLRYFIKNICGCCCINPGRLAKGQVGGSFARMVIQYPSGNTAGNTISNRVSAQVLRV